MALKLFAAAGTAFLLGIVGLGLSGGGLGHAVLPEPFNAIFVVVTLLAWLALVPLLVAACVAGVLAITAPRARRTATEAGWPAQTFTGPAWVETTPSGSELDAPRAGGQRRTGILTVLLLMTIGGVALFVRAAQRPAPDDVG